MPTQKVDPNDPMPLYYQVYISLLERIHSGEFLPGSMLPTERQIIEEYGVSRITVIKSMDLLEQDGLVKRQQGRGTFVTELERPKTEAHHEVTPTVAVISVPPTISTLDESGYLSTVLTGIYEFCSREGYPFQVHGFVSSSQEERDCVKSAIELGGRGLLIYAWPGYENAAFYRDLQERGFPLVMMDRYYPEVNTDCVLYDDEQAGFDLTMRMIHKGHKRIAFLLAHELKPTSVHDRLNGYRKALETCHMDYDEDLVWLDVPTVYEYNHQIPPSFAQSFSQLAERIENQGTTALVAVSFDVANSLMKQLMEIDERSKKRNLPRLSIEICAISHLPLYNRSPYLSTVAFQPGDLLGRTAAQLLINRIKGVLPAERQIIRLPMSILEP